MSFKLDFSENEDFPEVKDGDYEVVMSNVQEDANPNTGTEFINFDMIIRNDIKQGFQNSHIFQRIYRNKTTNKYPQKFIMRIAEAFSLEDGKSYNNFDDFMKDFLAKPAKLRVKNESSDYDGKTYNNLNVKRWTKTDFPQLQHKWPDKTNPNKLKNDDPFANNGQEVEISDSDLPF